jgi:hypothetical protein
MRILISLCSIAFLLSDFAFAQKKKLSNVLATSESVMKSSPGGNSKNKNRKERKPGKKKDNVSPMKLPPIPKNGNAPQLRSDKRLRMGIEQIDTAVHWIDRFIGDVLTKDGQKPNPSANDFISLSRLYLDIVGRIPTDDEATVFLKDRAKLLAPKEVSKCVDQLIESIH